MQTEQPGHLVGIPIEASPVPTSLRKLVGPDDGLRPRIKGPTAVTTRCKTSTEAASKTRRARYPEGNGSRASRPPRHSPRATHGGNGSVATLTTGRAPSGDKLQQGRGTSRATRAAASRDGRCPRDATRMRSLRSAGEQPGSIQKSPAWSDPRK